MKMIITSQWLDVPSTDPDDARRRILLNILLAGLAIAGLLALVAIIAVDLAGLEWSGQDRFTAYAGSIAVLIVPIVVFVINRYWSGWLASTIILLFLVAADTSSDLSWPHRQKCLK